MNLFTKQKDSPKGKLNVEDLKRLGWNALVFSAPALIVFFGQLQMGVEFKKALAVAGLVVYGLVIDFLKKLNNSK